MPLPRGENDYSTTPIAEEVLQLILESFNGNITMHLSSYNNMKRFISKYITSKEESPLKIADIGSQDVDLVGNYRSLFTSPLWQYCGVDMSAGANVDIVLHDPYHWAELDSNTFDIVISGQALEHIEFFWLAMLEIQRILKPGGICCLIAPSSGPEHRYPVDCWRFYPDGFRALAKYANLQVLEVYVQWDSEFYPDRDAVWNDCVLIAKKPEPEPVGWLGALKRLIKSRDADHYKITN